MRYALERWLYRLSISAEADSFVLKGALLFSVWFDTLNRPTRDADFLGYGSSDAASADLGRVGRRAATEPANGSTRSRLASRER